ncbi:hypothetical protein QBC47DRAFT_367835 [Echria macrotheca]|uniref:Peptide hydrolase n=1 Tax=Echria macrotheca TaxID=438768 RepID=A0AAJ0FG66_9PEZI|nr:hypothetical protein QBC47DRAFT_367835 [Echria macrotheca]
MLNPISFRRGPVTFWTTLVYLALLIPLIVINEKTPAVPHNLSSSSVNLTEAWLDLTALTKAYHPYNSRANEEVRNYLLQRVESILTDNGVSWGTEAHDAGGDGEHAVTVFNDLTSNCTFLMGQGIGGASGDKVARIGTGAYFEGTNIIVYIRGKQDDSGRFWHADVRDARRNEKGLTLVNAHYDSVSTGFGATDDGMGVASCLQVLQHFSHPDNQPDRGIVVMLNNGEEDYLYGARAFGQSPLLPYVHTFLNLEGAGAGGRALLFRSTDREVTAAYRGTPDPFGSVLGSDGFRMGFIKSGTDYSVLHDIYGQRGLDVAFFKPRARYHTNQDDAKHSSKESLAHMLSAAIHTMTRLSGDTGDTFVGPRAVYSPGKVANGSPSNGVWFDLFGKGFVVFGLRAMFAWSLSLLIATPLVLILVGYILQRLDKFYFFTSKVRSYDLPEDEPVSVGGWKGCFRFPFALVVAGALTIGSAYLLNKINPLVVYSSQYSVWAMMVSLFYFSCWTIMRGADFTRPSALHRGYATIWLFLLSWIALVFITVTEDRYNLGAGYPFVFLQSATFLATLVSLLEHFALPKRAVWGQQVHEDHEARDLFRALPHGTDGASDTPAVPHQESLKAPATRGSLASSSGSATAAATNQEDDEAAEEVAPDERTPLVGGDATGDGVRTTFATTYRRSISALGSTVRSYKEDGEPYEYEQAWSGKLPSWAWFFQFLLLGPMTIILFAQIGLMLTDATHQTGPDGSPTLLPFLVIAASTIFIFSPLTPFIHRVTHHIPVFLLTVLTATLIYNLVAFPFSEQNRYKAYFIQRIDLDTGDNKVCYTGIEEYIRPIVAAIPSAAGKEVNCSTGIRSGLQTCCYDGSAVAPRLSTDLPDGVPPEKEFSSLASINITRGDGNSAKLEISGKNTKACFLQFKRPVSSFSVEGGTSWDDRFGRYPELGVDNIKLWHRTWDQKWVVNIEWKDDIDDALQTPAASGPTASGHELGYGELRARDSGLDGTLICAWSDANVRGTIPALDEALQYSPPWAAITKTSEGLVEGRKSFKV